MAEGGKILADILKKVSEAARPNIATKYLDKLAGELIKSAGVRPAFLGYGGFPATLCVSVNDQVVHGVPSDMVLTQGDIIGLDLGIVYKGLITDSAMTVPVLGDLSYQEWAAANPKLATLLRITKEALNLGIKQARVGNRLSKIGQVIQGHIEKNDFGVVRDLVGHGVGKKLHEDPPVPNFDHDDGGLRLEEGMVIAIEPMVNLGSWQVKKGRDGFTYETKDKSPSAHFEHSVAITKEGPRILTK